MKKLIAMILVLALCLGGCAGTVQTQPTEEPMTTTEQTTAAPETTEEITTEATEMIESEETVIEAQGPLFMTKLSGYISQLPTDTVIADDQAVLDGGFYELGLGLDLI